MGKFDFVGASLVGFFSLQKTSLVGQFLSGSKTSETQMINLSLKRFGGTMGGNLMEVWIRLFSVI